MTQIQSSVPTPQPRPVSAGEGSKPSITLAQPATPVQAVTPQPPQESVTLKSKAGKATPQVSLGDEPVTQNKAAKKTSTTQQIGKSQPVERTVRVSAYGPGLYGNKTADGTRLTSKTIGLAHKSLPLGTKVDVTVNGRTVTAEVIDRGPYVKHREFDLTNGLINALGFANCTEFGVRSVAVRIHR